MTITTTKLIVGLAALTIALPMRAPLLASLPVRMTHTMDDACQWHRRPWLAVLGGDLRPAPTPEVARTLWHCEQRRGLKSSTPFLKVVLQRWPSSAELAAAASRQEVTEDAYQVPLSALVQARADDLRSNNPG